MNAALTHRFEFTKPDAPTIAEAFGRAFLAAMGATE